eukprot:scaffold7615_cov286-Pinguiococcus_pyrenoidosus.AAC.6
MAYSTLQRREAVSARDLCTRSRLQMTNYLVQPTLRGEGRGALIVASRHVYGPLQLQKDP